MKLTSMLGWLIYFAALSVVWLNINQHTIAASTEAQLAQRSPQVLAQQGTLEQESPNLNEYIGRQYVVSHVGEEAALPGNPTDLGGWVIGNPYATNGVDGRYGISQFLLGTTRLIFLEEYLSYDSSGRPTRLIIDAIRLPIDSISGESDSEEYSVQPSCLIGEREDPEILAVVGQDDSEYLTEIRQAWRANRSTGRFEEVPTDDVRCLNFSWGV